MYVTATEFSQTEAYPDLTSDDLTMSHIITTLCDTRQHPILAVTVANHPGKLEVIFCVRGVVSPLLSNVLLTPFDREMRRRGYRLTRYADDWVVTCCSRAEARRVLAEATKILKELGVTLNQEQTRIVQVRHGFEILGYKIKPGSRPLRLAPDRIRSNTRKGSLYAYPRQKSVQHLKDQIRQRTRRKAPVTTQELIEQINPVIRGWGLYYHKAHVRTLFHRLDRWIVHRLWSHRHKRWRCSETTFCWKSLPERKLYGELGLVNLVSLIPSLKPRH